jgi:RNA polymerase sigma-70 factor, ECF subfamily
LLTSTDAVKAGEVSDEGLVDQARGGDTRAFEYLYRRHVARVYAVCLRLAADPVRAEESTQEAFVHAWEHLAAFRGESPFEHWICRIAVNTSLVSLRTRRRRGSWEALTDGVDHHPAASEKYGARIDLENAIAGLPPQARAVLVLHDIEGYHHEEIGTLMNIAPGTSKAQLHRARRLLREALR